MYPAICREFCAILKRERLMRGSDTTHSSTHTATNPIVAPQLSHHDAVVRFGFFSRSASAAANSRGISAPVGVTSQAINWCDTPRRSAAIAWHSAGCVTPVDGLGSHANRRGDAAGVGG